MANKKYMLVSKELANNVAEAEDDILSGRIYQGDLKNSCADLKKKMKIYLKKFGNTLVPRSLARRVLVGLEKFSIILFDFDKVPTVGQAFADEIFRVFHNKYPHIKLETENMEPGVKFMVERAKSEAENEKK